MTRYFLSLSIYSFNVHQIENHVAEVNLTPVNEYIWDDINNQNNTVAVTSQSSNLHSRNIIFNDFMKNVE